MTNDTNDTNKGTEDKTSNDKDGTTERCKWDLTERRSATIYHIMSTRSTADKLPRKAALANWKKVKV